MKLSKTKLRDWISPKKWKAVVQSIIIKKVIGGPEYCEQVLYRLDKCGECVQRGYCHKCGCPMPDKAMVPSEKCIDENGAMKWGPMMSKKIWEEFKTIYKCTINISS